MRNTYIFLCSNETEDECLDSLLFGGTEGYRSKAKVDIGDTLFLYNYKSGTLHGIFTATTESAMNIIPNAWGGKFPWQVKVKRETEYPYLTRSDFEDFINIRRGMPQGKLSPEQLEKLLEKFKSPERIPPQEIDYRNDNPADKWTMDRHKVRSMSEVIIDDWLFTHKIAHGYEGSVKVDKEEMFCDFFIPTNTYKKYIYIEFWGLSEKKYTERKEHKKALYKAGNLTLIELEPKDLEKLDEILLPKLTDFTKTQLQ